MDIINRFQDVPASVAASRSFLIDAEWKSMGVFQGGRLFPMDPMMRSIGEHLPYDLLGNDLWRDMCRAYLQTMSDAIDWEHLPYELLGNDLLRDMCRAYLQTMRVNFRVAVSAFSSCSRAWLLLPSFADFECLKRSCECY